MPEFGQEQNPFRGHLAVEAIVQIDGVVKVPGGARFSIDRAVIERYRAS
jgi:hypothetical protein